MMIFPLAQTLNGEDDDDGLMINLPVSPRMDLKLATMNDAMINTSCTMMHDWMLAIAMIDQLASSIDDDGVDLADDDDSIGMACNDADYCSVLIS